MQKNIDFNIKDLSLRYGVKYEHLNYLKYKKNYTDNKIKKIVFETKYGEGCPKTNYFNYYLPRVVVRNNDFISLKNDFFTDYKLVNSLSRLEIENLWEELMNHRLKL